MSEYVSRADLLGRSKRRYVDVPLPTGGKVRVRSLSEAERTEHEMSVLDAKGDWKRSLAAQQRRRLIAVTVCDGEGSLLFSTRNLEEVARLDSADAAAIFDAAAKLSGLRKSDIEELEGNSEEADGSDSPDGSPCDGESLTLSAGSTS